jgi:hypothetical protein
MLLHKFHMDFAIVQNIVLVMCNLNGISQLLLSPRALCMCAFKVSLLPRFRHKILLMRMP